MQLSRELYILCTIMYYFVVLCIMYYYVLFCTIMCIMYYDVLLTNMYVMYNISKIDFNWIWIKQYYINIFFIFYMHFTIFQVEIEFGMQCYGLLFQQNGHDLQPAKRPRILVSGVGSDPTSPWPQNQRPTHPSSFGRGFLPDKTFSSTCRLGGLSVPTLVTEREIFAPLPPFFPPFLPIWKKTVFPNSRPIFSKLVSFDRSIKNNFYDISRNSELWFLAILGRKNAYSVPLLDAPPGSHVLPAVTENGRGP